MQKYPEKKTHIPKVIFHKEIQVYIRVKALLKKIIAKKRLTDKL